jgi:hypothetical protein
MKRNGEKENLREKLPLIYCTSTFVLLLDPNQKRERDNLQRLGEKLKKRERDRKWRN